MKRTSSSQPAAAAFTRLDLIVIVACLGFLALLILPAMANNRTQNAGAGCLGNLRRLMAAYEMYRQDNNDYLMPNPPVGSFEGWAGNSLENWTTSTWNTNVSAYANSLMGTYLNRDITPFRCPGDVVPSDNGRRLRSYSMSGATVGLLPSSTMTQVRTLLSNARLFVKGSDLTCPGPANTFVFLDESPVSIDDAFFQLSMTTPNYPNIPAGYLDNGCGFSFADGHGEIHRWRSPYITVPVTKNSPFPPLGTSGLDLDWKWLREHASCF